MSEHIAHPAATGNYFELTYADIPTFGRAPLVDASDLRDVDVAVYGVPWDATASPRPGARLGPRRIREESQLFYEIWNPIDTPMISIGGDESPRIRERIGLGDCGDVTIYPYDIERTRSSIHSLSATVASQSFPVMIGGDHYVQFPAYQGVCDAHPGSRIGIVQIDAHDDSISDDPILGRHWCGSNIQRSLEYSSLDPRAIAMVGLRNFIGAKQVERHRSEKFNVITMDEARELGPREVADKAVGGVLEHCDLVYLTVDIDAADPSVAPGCGGPSPGGFMSHEFMSLMRELGRHKEIIAMDLVEVAPNLDPTEQTPLFAAFALFHFIEMRFFRE